MEERPSRATTPWAPYVRAFPLAAPASVVLVTLRARALVVLATQPHRRASFRVLKAPDLPAVLLELGFLDSETDRDRLADPAWMARTARAVAAGIVGWRKVASPGFLKQRR